MEPRWLGLATVQAIHAEAIAAYGGSAGVRDMGLLESALDRPRNLFAYGDDPSIFDLAAACCAGIVGNHPFVDGNQRAGLLAAVAFLDLTGHVFRPTEADAVLVTMALAAGEIDESALYAWFAEYSSPKRN